MPDWLREVFSSEYFVPHGHCFLWKPGMLGLHAVANALTAISCFAIAVTLLGGARRRPAPAPLALYAGATLFATSGLTHVLDLVVVWNPIYWVQGGLRALAAVAAIVTAVTLPRLFAARPRSAHQISNQDA